MEYMCASASVSPELLLLIRADNAGSREKGCITGSPISDFVPAFALPL